MKRYIDTAGGRQKNFHHDANLSRNFRDDIKELSKKVGTIENSKEMRENAEEKITDNNLKKKFAPPKQGALKRTASKNER